MLKTEIWLILLILISQQVLYSESQLCSSTWQPLEAGRTWSDVGRVYNGTTVLATGDRFILQINNSYADWNITQFNITTNFGSAAAYATLSNPLLTYLSTANTTNATWAAANSNVTLVFTPLDTFSLLVTNIAAASCLQVALDLVINPAAAPLTLGLLQYPLAPAMTYSASLLAVAANSTNASFSIPETALTSAPTLLLQAGVLFQMVSPQNVVINARQNTNITVLVQNLGTGRSFFPNVTVLPDANVRLNSISDGLSTLSLNPQGWSQSSLGPAETLTLTLSVSPLACGTFASSVQLSDLVTTTPLSSPFILSVVPDYALLSFINPVSCATPVGGGQATCSVTIQNLATGTASANVTLTLDAASNFTLVSPTPLAVNGNLLTLNISAINGLSQLTLPLVFSYPNVSTASACNPIAPSTTVNVALTYLDPCYVQYTAPATSLTVSVSLPPVPTAAVSLTDPLSFPFYDTGAFASTLTASFTLLSALTPNATLTLQCAGLINITSYSPAAATIWLNQTDQSQSTTVTWLLNASQASNFAMDFVVSRSDACFIGSRLGCQAILQATYSAAACPLTATATISPRAYSTALFGNLPSSRVSFETPVLTAYETGPPDNGDGLQGPLEADFVTLSATFVIPSSQGLAALDLSNAMFTDDFAGQSTTQLVAAGRLELQVTYPNCSDAACDPLPIPPQSILQSQGQLLLALGPAFSAYNPISCNQECQYYTVTIIYQFTVDDATLGGAVSARIEDTVSLFGFNASSWVGGCSTNIKSYSMLLFRTIPIMRADVQMGWSISSAVLDPCVPYTVNYAVTTSNVPPAWNVTSNISFSVLDTYVSGPGISPTGSCSLQVAADSEDTNNNVYQLAMSDSPLPAGCTGLAASWQFVTSPLETTPPFFAATMAFNTLEAAVAGLQPVTRASNLTATISSPQITASLTPSQFALTTNSFSWLLKIINTQNTPFFPIIGAKVPADFSLASSSLPATKVNNTFYLWQITPQLSLAQVSSLSARWTISASSNCQIGANDHAVFVYSGCSVNGPTVLKATLPTRFSFPTPSLKADILNQVASLCAPGSFIMRLINNGQTTLYNTSVAFDLRGLASSGPIFFGPAQTQMTQLAGNFTSVGNQTAQLLLLNASNWATLSQLTPGQVIFLSFSYTFFDAPSYNIYTTAQALSPCGANTPYSSPSKFTLLMPQIQCTLLVENLRKPAAPSSSANSLSNDGLLYLLTCRNTGTITLKNVVVQLNIGRVFTDLLLLPQVTTTSTTSDYSPSNTYLLAASLTAGSSASVTITQLPNSTTCPLQDPLPISANISYGCSATQPNTLSYFLATPPTPPQIYFNSGGVSLSSILTPVGNGAAVVTVTMSTTTPGVAVISSLQVSLPNISTSSWVYDIQQPTPTLVVSAGPATAISVDASAVGQPVFTFQQLYIELDRVATARFNFTILFNLNDTASSPIPSNVQESAPASDLLLSASAIANMTLLWYQSCTPATINSQSTQLTINLYPDLDITASAVTAVFNQATSSAALTTVVWTIANNGVNDAESRFRFSLINVGSAISLKSLAPVVVAAGNACNLTSVPPACLMGASLAAGATVQIQATFQILWTDPNLRSNSSLRLLAQLQGFVLSPSALNNPVRIHSLDQTEPIYLGAMPTLFEQNTSLPQTATLSLAVGEQGTYFGQIIFFGTPYLASPNVTWWITFDSQLDFLWDIPNTTTSAAITSTSASAVQRRYAINTATANLPAGALTVNSQIALRLNNTRFLSLPSQSNMTMTLSFQVSVANVVTISADLLTLAVTRLVPMLSVQEQVGINNTNFTSFLTNVEALSAIYVRAIISNLCNALAAPIFDLTVVTDPGFPYMILVPLGADGIDNNGDGVIDEPNEGSVFPVFNKSGWANSSAISNRYQQLLPCTNFTVLYTLLASSNITTGTIINFTSTASGFSMPDLPHLVTDASFTASQMAALRFRQVGNLATSFAGIVESSTANNETLIGEQFYYNGNLTFPPGLTRQGIINITIPVGLYLLSVPSVTLGPALSAETAFTVSPSITFPGTIQLGLANSYISLPLTRALTGTPDSDRILSFQLLLQAANNASMVAGRLYQVQVWYTDFGGVVLSSAPSTLLVEPTRLVGACSIGPTLNVGNQFLNFTSSLSSRETVLNAYVTGLTYTATTATFVNFRYVPFSVVMRFNNVIITPPAEPTLTNISTNTQLSFTLATPLVLTPGSNISINWQFYSLETVVFGSTFVGTVVYSWQSINTTTSLPSFPLTTAGTVRGPRIYTNTTTSTQTLVRTMPNGFFQLTQRTLENPTANSNVTNTSGVVGEQHLYLATIPLDNMFYSSMTLAIVIPSGMAMVTRPTVTLNAIQSTGTITLPTVPVYGPTTSNVVIPNVLVNQTNSTNRALTVTWVTQVVNNNTAVAGARLVTSITNTASAGSARTTFFLLPNSTINVVEPSVSIASFTASLSNTTYVQRGDTVFYSLALRASGQATAFNLMVTVLLSSDLVYSPLTASLMSCTTSPAQCNTLFLEPNITNNNLLLSWLGTASDMLVPGNNLTLRFMATIKNSAMAGSPIPAAGYAYWTSLNGSKLSTGPSLQATGQLSARSYSVNTNTSFSVPIMYWNSTWRLNRQSDPEPPLPSVVVGEQVEFAWTILLQNLGYAANALVLSFPIPSGCLLIPRTPLTLGSHVLSVGQLTLSPSSPTVGPVLFNITLGTINVNSTLTATGLAARSITGLFAVQILNNAATAFAGSNFSFTASSAQTQLPFAPTSLSLNVVEPSAALASVVSISKTVDVNGGDRLTVLTQLTNPSAVMSLHQVQLQFNSSAFVYVANSSVVSVVSPASNLSFAEPASGGSSVWLWGRGVVNLILPPLASMQFRFDITLLGSVPFNTSVPLPLTYTWGALSQNQFLALTPDANVTLGPFNTLNGTRQYSNSTSQSIRTMATAFNITTAFTTDSYIYTPLNALQSSAVIGEQFEVRVLVYLPNLNIPSLVVGLDADPSLLYVSSGLILQGSSIASIGVSRVVTSTGYPNSTANPDVLFGFTNIVHGTVVPGFDANSYVGFSIFLQVANAASLVQGSALQIAPFFNSSYTAIPPAIGLDIREPLNVTILATAVTRFDAHQGGDLITYSISVVNSESSLAAYGLTLRATLTQATYDSSSLTPTSVSGDLMTVSWTVGNLLARTNATWTLKLLLLNSVQTWTTVPLSLQASYASLSSSLFVASALGSLDTWNGPRSYNLSASQLFVTNITENVTVAITNHTEFPAASTSTVIGEQFLVTTRVDLPNSQYLNQYFLGSLSLPATLSLVRAPWITLGSSVQNATRSLFWNYTLSSSLPTSSQQVLNYTIGNLSIAAPPGDQARFLIITWPFQQLNAATATAGSSQLLRFGPVSTSSGRSVPFNSASDVNIVVAEPLGVTVNVTTNASGPVRGSDIVRVTLLLRNANNAPTAYLVNLQLSWLSSQLRYLNGSSSVAPSAASNSTSLSWTSLISAFTAGSNFTVTLNFEVLGSSLLNASLPLTTSADWLSINPSNNMATLPALAATNTTFGPRPYRLMGVWSNLLQAVPFPDPIAAVFQYIKSAEPTTSDLLYQINLTVGEQAQFQFDFTLTPISFTGNMSIHFGLQNAAWSLVQWSTSAGAGVASYQSAVVLKNPNGFDLVLQNVQINSTNSALTTVQLRFVLQLLNNPPVVGLQTGSQFPVSVSANVDYIEPSFQRQLTIGTVTPTQSWQCQLVEPANYVLQVVHTAAANVEGGNIFSITYTFLSQQTNSDSVAFQPVIDVWLPQQLSYINQSASLQSNPTLTTAQSFNASNPRISFDANSGLTQLRFPPVAGSLLGLSPNSTLTVQFNVLVSAHSLANSSIAWQAVASWASLDGNTSIVAGSLGALGTSTGPRNYSTAAIRSTIQTQSSIVASSLQLSAHTTDSSSTFLSRAPVPCPIGTQLQYTLSFNFFRLSYPGTIRFTVRFDSRLTFFAQATAISSLGAEVDGTFAIFLNASLAADGTAFVDVSNLSCIDPDPQADISQRFVALLLSFQVPNDATLTSLQLLPAVTLSTAQYATTDPLPAAAIGNALSPALRIAEQIPVSVSLISDSPSAPIVPRQVINFTLSIANQDLYGPLEQLAIWVTLNSRFSYVPGSAIQNGAAFIDPLLENSTLLVWNSSALSKPDTGATLVIRFSVLASPFIPLAGNFPFHAVCSWASLNQTATLLTLPALGPLDSANGPRSYGGASSTRLFSANDRTLFDSFLSVSASSDVYHKAPFDRLVPGEQVRIDYSLIVAIYQADLVVTFTFPSDLLLVSSLTIEQGVNVSETSPPVIHPLQGSPIVIDLFGVSGAGAPSAPARAYRFAFDLQLANEASVVRGTDLSVSLTAEVPGGDLTVPVQPDSVLEFLVEEPDPADLSIEVVPTIVTDTVEGGDAVLITCEWINIALDPQTQWPSEIQLFLPIGLNYVPGSSFFDLPSGAHVSQEPTVVATAGLSALLVWNTGFSALRVTEGMTVSFNAVVDNAVQPAQILSTSFAVTWVSINGSLSDALPLAAAGASNGARVYSAASANASVTVTSEFWPLSSFMTSMNASSDLLIGEQVLLEVTLQLPPVYRPGPLTASVLYGPLSFFQLVDGPYFASQLLDSPQLTANHQLTAFSSDTMRLDVNWYEAVAFGNRSANQDRYVRFNVTFQVLNIVPDAAAGQTVFFNTFSAYLVAPDLSSPDSQRTLNIREPLPVVLTAATPNPQADVSKNFVIDQQITVTNLAPLGDWFSETYDPVLTVAIYPGTAVAYVPGSASVGQDPTVEVAVLSTNPLLLTWSSATPTAFSSVDYQLIILSAAETGADIYAYSTLTWTSLPGDNLTVSSQAPPLAAVNSSSGERSYLQSLWLDEGVSQVSTGPAALSTNLTITTSSEPTTQPDSFVVVGEQIEVMLEIELLPLSYSGFFTITLEVSEDLLFLDTPVQYLTYSQPDIATIELLTREVSDTSLTFVIGGIQATVDAEPSVLQLFAQVQVLNLPGITVDLQQLTIDSSVLYTFRDDQQTTLPASTNSVVLEVGEPLPLLTEVACYPAAWPVEGLDVIDCKAFVANLGDSSAFELVALPSAQPTDLVFLSLPLLNVNEEGLIFANNALPPLTNVTLPFQVQVLNSAPFGAVIPIVLDTLFQSLSPATTLTAGSGPLAINETEGTRQYHDQTQCSFNTTDQFFLMFVLTNSSEATRPALATPNSSFAVVAGQFVLTATLHLPALAIDAAWFNLSLPSAVQIIAPVEFSSSLSSAVYTNEHLYLAPLSVTDHYALINLTEVTTTGDRSQLSDRYIEMTFLVQLRDLPNVGDFGPSFTLTASAEVLSTSRTSLTMSTPSESQVVFRPIDPAVLMSSDNTVLISGSSFTVTSVITLATPFVDGHDLFYSVDLRNSVASSPLDFIYVANSATVNGAPVEPVIHNGQQLLWPDVVPLLSGNARVEIILQLQAPQLQPSDSVAKTIDVGLVWLSSSNLTAFQPFAFGDASYQPRAYHLTQPLAVTTLGLPIAQDDLFILFENVPTWLDVLANDRATHLPHSEQPLLPNADTLALFNPGDIVNLELLEGQFKYTPPLRFTGTSVFAYSVASYNDTAAISYARVVVVVVPNLYPPQVTNDYVSTCVACSTLIDPLVNDFDLDGNLDPSSLRLVSAPQFGTAELLPQGFLTAKQPLLRYQSDDEYFGLDRFDYQVCDTSGECFSAVVWVTVTGQQATIITQDDSAVTWTNTPVILDILNNDFEAQPKAAEKDNEAVLDTKGAWLISILVPPTTGTLSITLDEQLLGRRVVEYSPAAGFVGYDTFSYRVCSPHSYNQTCSKEALVLIEVNGNLPPVLRNDLAYFVKQQSRAIDVAANDFDLDDGLDLTSLSLVSGPSWGTVVHQAGTTVLTYTWTTTDSDILSDSLRYSLCDLSGQCSTAQLTVIRSANRAPLVRDDSFSVRPSQAAVLPVALNDHDFELNLDFASMAIFGPLPAGGTITNIDRGNITYVSAPGTTVDSFQYRLCDSLGLCAVASVSITVLPASPPVCVDDYSRGTTNRLQWIFPLANDHDPLGGLLLPASFSVVRAPSHGSYLFDSTTQSFQYQPNAQFVGTDEAIYAICDVNQQCSQATIWLTVRSASTPVAADDLFVVPPAVLSIQLNLLRNDHDEASYLNPSSITVLQQPLRGTVTTLPVGDVVYTSSDPASATRDNFTYRVCNIDGLCSNEATVDLVFGNQAAPRCFDDSLVMALSTVQTFNVTDNDDISGLTGGDFFITVIDGPYHAAAFFDPLTKLLTVQPDVTFVGTFSFRYQLCFEVEVSGLVTGVLNTVCDTATVTVSVTAPDLTTIRCVDDDVKTSVNSTGVLIHVLTNDLDPWHLLVASTVKIATGPSSGVAEAQPDGTLLYSPQSDFLGIESLVYTVADIYGNVYSATVVLSVQTNLPPQAADDYLTLVRGSTDPVAIDVLLNDFDSDSALDINSLAITQQPAAGLCVVQSPSGWVTFLPGLSPLPAATSPLQCEYMLCDQQAACSRAIIHIYLLDHQPPVAVDDVAVLNKTAYGAASARTEINVLANDYDADGEPLVVKALRLLSPPTHGRVIVDETRNVAIYYSERTLDNEVDSFVYQIVDRFGATAEATVFIADSLQLLPVARDDVVTSVGLHAVLFDPTLNDVDPFGLGFSRLAVITPPSFGKIDSLTDAHGQPLWVYSPVEATLPLFDRLDYQVCVLPGRCAIAHVTILIAAANAPTAVDDVAFASPGALLQINALVNDYDIDGDLDVDSLQLLSAPLSEAGAQVLVRPDHAGRPVVVYLLPSTASPSVQTDTLQYQVCDATKLCSIASIQVQLSAAALPFAAAADAYFIAALPGTSLPMYVLSNDDLPAAYRPLQLSVLQQPIFGQVGVDQVALSLVYQTNNDLATNDTLTDYLVYQVCTLLGRCTSASVSIKLQPNTAPIAIDDSASTFAGRSVLIQVLANDLDSEGNLLPATLEITGTATSGTARLAGRPGVVVYQPGQGFSGTDTFNYRVADAGGLSSSAQVTVVVESLPDVLLRDDEASTVADSPRPILIAILNNDSPGEGAQFDARTLVLGTPSAGGLVAAEFAGLVSYLPAPGFSSGQDVFNYTICTSESVCGTAAVTVQVLPASDNHAPVAVSDWFQVNALPPATSSPYLTETAITALDVLKNDVDLDGNLDARSLRVLFGPIYGRLTGRELDTGILLYQPLPGYSNRVDHLTYEICDTSLLCTNARVQIVLVSNEAAPSLSFDLATTTANTPTVTFLADRDANGALLDRGSWVAESSQTPAHGQFSYNPLDQSLAFVPYLDSAVHQEFQLIGCDLTHRCASTAGLVWVAPTFITMATDEIFTVTSGAPFSASVLANDNPTNLATLQAVSAPSHAATFDFNSAGVFTYTSEPGFVGIDQFKYLLCNTFSFCQSAVLFLNVVADSSALPPLARNDQVELYPVQSEIGIPLLINDFSPLGELDLASVTVVQPPSHGTVQWHAASQSMIYQPDSPRSTEVTDSFVYSVANTLGLNASATAFVHYASDRTSIRASPYAITTSPGQSVALFVLADHFSLQPEDVTLSIDGLPSSSVVGSFTADLTTATVTFYPVSSFVGTTSIRYRLCYRLYPSVCHSSDLTFTVLSPSC